jgi:NADH-quinone oxidoreductase subunit J
MFTIPLFVLFGGLALGCAVSMVVQRNPLYSAISLIGVFISLAGLYVLLAAPFIAAVQVIVYAGAIMVLVVFVIMLLNVEEEEHGPSNWRFVAVGLMLGAILFGEAAFVLYSVGTPRAAQAETNVGLTASIGTGLFTEYLLPFEITSVLILMAIVGAMTLARRDPAGQADMSAAEMAVGSGGDLRQLNVGEVVPGQTAASGVAMARMQIEKGDAAAPASEGLGGSADE